MSVSDNGYLSAYDPGLDPVFLKLCPLLDDVNTVNSIYAGQRLHSGKIWHMTINIFVFDFVQKGPVK